MHESYCQKDAQPYSCFTSLRHSICGKVKSASKNISTFDMALGCVTLNPARNCHFTEYKNVHNTTLSTKIALYTYEKMVQIYVGNMINIS